MVAAGSPSLCTLMVCLQRDPVLFNKAAIMNVGYAEAMRRWKGQFDCVVFHDIDLIMEDDRNIITCGHNPVHYGVYLDRRGYR